MNSRPCHWVLIPNMAWDERLRQYLPDAAFWCCPKHSHLKLKFGLGLFLNGDVRMLLRACSGCPTRLLAALPYQIPHVGDDDVCVARLFFL